MKIEYGMATAADLPRIVEIKLLMFEEAGHLHLLADDAESLILNDYRYLYHNDIARHFVARTESHIIASVGAFIKSDLPYRYYTNAWYGFIGDVYTAKVFRGKGIATNLSDKALNWLKNKGVDTVRLLASDKGRPIYESRGFTATDEMQLVFGA